MTKKNDNGVLVATRRFCCSIGGPISCQVPFREAHAHSGTAVAMAEKRGVQSMSLRLGELKRPS